MRGTGQSPSRDERFGTTEDDLSLVGFGTGEMKRSSSWLQVRLRLAVHPRVIGSRALPEGEDTDMHKTIVATIAAGAALATAGILAAPASAAPARPAEVERETMGSCSAGARWDLNLEREFGVIDIDFEIDAATPGEKWTVSITRNGSKVLRVSQVADREGEIDVNHIVRDRAGSDRIAVSATSASGQTCRGSLRI